MRLAQTSICLKVSEVGNLPRDDLIHKTKLFFCRHQRRATNIRAGCAHALAQDDRGEALRLPEARVR